jgi:hypothetical protein
MILEKKIVISGSIIKAIATTAIIGMALKGIETISKLNDIGTQAITVSGIIIICILGTILYFKELRNCGAIKSIKQIIQTFDIDWEDSTHHLLVSWLYGGLIGLLAIQPIFFYYFGNAFELESTAISFCFGIAFAYIMRKDCKIIIDYLKYFAYGALFGIGMIITGITIGILVFTFGLFWIGLLISIDVMFTGIYTYLDLLEWVHETEPK